MHYHFSEIEPRILKFWQDNKTWQKAKERNTGKENYYFLDGPPYTSGKVHIGTAWNKALKDCFIRYKRMRGSDIWDRAGYDMHGLPTENAAQKKLGLKTKEDIEAFGVEKFIEECKKLCVENMRLMNRDFIRLGVWMDFENAYQSISKEFIEGEWWLIKRAHEQGRLYEGLRTMTWDMESESALAKHELEYKTVVDPSIFLKFKLKGKDEFLIIWTTTPWTIPLNLAVMVNPDEDYVKAKVGDEVWIVANALANVFFGGVVDKQYTILETFKGEKMEGWRYEHPFYEELKPHFAPIHSASEKAHTVVLSTEYVDTSSGSGLVHCAPGCGPEDYEVGHANGLPPFNPIDEKGYFPESMGPFAGFRAKQDDLKIIDVIKQSGCLVAQNEVEHEYPHDWRHHKPVIFRATKQWFFKVEDLKEKMIAENRGIKWVPESAFNAFDSWLSNLRDNSISKQRYWGTPLPIWRNVKDPEDIIVIGSLKELEKLSGQKFDDLHISTLDEVEIKRWGKTYKRVPDILDVWVDAGSASWNCLDYPQKKKDFEDLFPADFILEGKDQIRGWFNLLMVASMIAIGKPSFKNVYMHGFVQDALGRKMSKSAGNYITPDEVIDKWGADSFRYYAIGGAKPGLDLNYNFEDLKGKHKNLAVLWNTHVYLLELCKTNYINPAKLTRLKQFSAEENFLLSRLQSTIKSVTKAYDEFRIDEVPALLEELYLQLSRTYIQLIRDKAALGSQEEKEIVAFTLYQALRDILRMFATIAPFISEEMYQHFRAAFQLPEESVHLLGWPEVSESLIDAELEQDFAAAGDVMQAILAAREKIQRGVRWPVKEAIVVCADPAIAERIRKSEKMILAQTHVKSLQVLPKLPAIKNIVRTDFKSLAPDFGEKAPQIISKLALEHADTILTHLEKEGVHKIKLGTELIELQRKHLLIERVSPQNLVEAQFRQGFVYLNSDLDERLLAEGYAREVTRRVQALRKKAGLERKDDIALILKVPEHLAKLLFSWQGIIKEKVGAVSLELLTSDPPKKPEHYAKETLKEHTAEIWLEKR
ncbi:isoleucine--tRNA ligase [Candidatus Woesearchaeota archaeon]|nr:isoleucine--tRNA ligase [Candidatus Woesearchaeota archaeon]